mmetsp:Transcript_11079/g.19535  ORF Transcript_11079/g.19535 Transcript_11079/m.19535 type:complete len:451 (-) Transcript_11079:190-1542(-)
MTAETAEVVAEQLKVEEAPAFVSAVTSSNVDVKWGEVTKSGAVTDQDIGALTSASANTTNPAALGSAAKKVLAVATAPEALTFTLKAVEAYLLPDVAGRAPQLFGVEGDLLSGSSQKHPKLAFSEIVNQITHVDVEVKERATYLAAHLMAVSESPVPDNEVIMIIAELTKRLQVPPIPDGSTSAALQSLAVLLRGKQARTTFTKINGLGQLLQLVKRMEEFSMDAQYHLMLSTWLACFDPKAASTVDQAGLSILMDVIRHEPMVRVARVCVATLRAIISRDPGYESMAAEAIIEKKGPKLFEALRHKEIPDEELNDDLDWMMDTLSRNFKVLTTFERHEQELLTKTLNWSMIHEELFWKENATKFEHNNFKSVQLLIELLDSSDPQTVAVACSDLGNFVRYFPNGKLIVDKYGGKDKIMSLLGNSNPEIRKHALSACSKIMINNWESFKA